MVIVSGSRIRPGDPLVVGEVFRIVPFLSSGAHTGDLRRDVCRAFVDALIEFVLIAACPTACTGDDGLSCSSERVLCRGHFV